MSKYDDMHKNPSHWKFGMIYYCADDPRIIVRQLFPIGWTWNFGHPFVFPAILLTVLFFLTPISIAYFVGIRSKLIFFVIIAISLVLVILMANRLARDPDKERR